MINNDDKLELNYKIEKEKTKQLELLKDIKKIEKSIKQKELYIRYYKNKKQYTSNNCDFETNSETDSETESDYEIESNYESESDLEIEYENKTDFILDCINIKCIKKRDYDTLSISSYDSDYDYDKEININL
jgi:hypothetical protein